MKIINQLFIRLKMQFFESKSQRITKVEEERVVDKTATFAECFGLLKDKYVLFFFLGIMAHVGLDVGINITDPKLLMERLEITLADAGFATIFYFIFRTAGCLLGSFLLAKFGDKRVFIINVSLILIGILSLFSADKSIIYTGIALFGLGNSNIFISCHVLSNPCTQTTQSE